jgi:hypothetical protein
LIVAGFNSLPVLFLLLILNLAEELKVGVHGRKP